MSETCHCISQPESYCVQCGGLVQRSAYAAHNADAALVEKVAEAINYLETAEVGYNAAGDVFAASTYLRNGVRAALKSLRDASLTPGAPARVQEED